MEGMTTMGIFRCVKDGSSLNVEYQKTMRPPGNVPYVVDNLWEWKRPEGRADRRRSAFASPRVDLAQESGPKGGIVYRVEFEGDVKLCQLVGYPDSKYHPDCVKLRNLLIDRLRQEGWIDSKLYMPGAHESPRRAFHWPGREHGSDRPNHGHCSRGSFTSLHQQPFFVPQAEDTPRPRILIPRHVLA